MRALVISGPQRAEVQQVEPPAPAAGEVVVDVRRAGICGTDLEFFTGEMAYLASGHARYPMRIGHEWMGVVSAVGADTSASLIGRRVTGDTMLGCGSCRRCATGRQHVCADRYEVGIRGGWPGALAEQLAVPATSLHLLPDSVDDAAGAMVEPGGNALRAVQAADIVADDTILVTGSGTIALLCAMFARAAGAEVHLVGRSDASLRFARSLGFHRAWTWDTLPEVPWDAVIEASNSALVPPRACRLVEPGKRVVLIGVAGAPSEIDTRDLVLNDVTAVGILSASPGLAQTVEAYATGVIDPRPLIAGAVTLEDLPSVLAGERPVGASDAPKFHVAL